MKLTNTACNSAKPKEKPYKMADGQGMYLEIKPNGSKYWRMAYRIHGKQKLLSFGVYPEISLKYAREKRREARKLLEKGIEPIKVHLTRPLVFNLTRSCEAARADKDLSNLWRK